MNYRSVFAKSYLRERDKGDCYERGRDPKHCPADEIVKVLLKPVYGPNLRFSACESSASLVTRPDPLFSVLHRRATRQVYIFEKASPLGNYDSLVGALDLRCASLSEMLELQTSQQWEKATFCAFGYLRPPTYMTFESGYSLPLLNFYSSHIGLLPFLCTPYMSHHNFFGYLCAQAAIYLSLEISLPLGGAPQSPATLSHMAASIADTRSWRPPHKPLLCKQHVGNHKVKPKDGYFCRGLNVPEITALLDDEQLQTRGLEFHAEQMGLDYEEATALHVRFMLDSRIPIIAVVDFNSLARHVLRRSLLLDQVGAHVITIIGYSVHRPDEVTRIIFHDGHLGPYREVKLSGFVDSARKSPDHFGVPADRILLFSPLPRRVSPDGYLDLFQVASLYRELYEYNMRLCSIGQLAQYLTKYTPSHPMFSPEIITDWLKQRLTEIGTQTTEETYPIWLIEYVHKDNRTVYIDIFDGVRSGSDNARRLGVLYLGRDPERDAWELVRTKHNVSLNFYREVERASKEAKLTIGRV